ncbi:probable serine/threonine-protein kinase nek3 [Drosophila sulfurigaster albostrigata]|uniref:probable serine/threonine-protein kinase nek3 n=1 Tax=Drosophila sulfurigaster albostrigata TaxID=89887 RepID=UPI002D2186F7|nr:probable serine/threonine-protein kinase nek3 [Drosophila sulfurigaster albostrigata]XP_062134634.1 probable serine/threonine-protein kinase nek3 [Drosophila sulfurigaster albostrigata]
MLRYWSIIFLINCAFCTETQITQTVYGFLDFTTTIGNTVMVFSPQSAPPLEISIHKTTPKPTSIIETRPNTKQNEPSKDGIKPTPLIASSSKEEAETTSSFENNNIISLSNTPIKTLDYPEYALLSRQPEEFVEETFRLVNLKSRSDGDRQRIYPSKRDNTHNLSSGLYSNKKSESVSKISAISAKSSIKYAQSPQSVSSSEKRNKNRSQSSSRVLKTITPQSSRTVESTPQQNGFTKSSRKSNRDPSEKRKSSRNKGKRRHKNTHSSSIQITATAVDTSSRRSFRTKTNQPSLPSLPSPPSEENFANLGQNTLKLNRRPGRWQYKSAPKPKVNIRKTSNSTNNSKNATSADSINEAILETDEKFATQKLNNLGRDLEAVGSQNSVVADNDELKPKNFVRTLNVEISTPSNFVDTYYEIATIKSPFVFQAGLVKKTRFLTITSTIEKTLKTDQIEEYSKDDGPLSENILESTMAMNEPSLDGSISTLKPIYITDSLETPELETITDSFSVTQTKLRTQILPIIFEKKNETVQITLVQTFDYTSLVTVTQTISPFRDNFIPAKNFKDFAAILDEAGSELNLDLEFGDEGNGGQFEGKVKLESKGNSTNIIPNIQSEKINIPEISVLNPLNPSNNLITSTRPVIKLETIWESYVVPLVRGTDSVLRTLSKSVGVVEKTEYITEVSTLPVLPMSQYPYSINPFYNPLLQLPQQQLITSTSILNTLVTATSSKVLKLTFGARTAYTTIFSTSVVPTEVTQLITATLPVQNQGAFPNYYPPPYPPFGYVG